MYRVRQSAVYHLVLCFLLLLSALVVGTRDLSVGEDTYNYATHYYRTQDCKCLVGGYELGFKLLTYFVAMTGASIEVYFTVVASVLFLAVWITLSQFIMLLDVPIPERWRVRTAMLSLVLVSPFFLSASINVLRHGISAFFLLTSIALFLRRKWVSAICVFSLAALFHRTALLYVFVFPCLKLGGRHPFPRVVLMAVVGLSVMYAVGAAEALVKGVSSVTGLPIHETVSLYGAHSSYKRGSRLDFLVFSLGWLALGRIASRFLVLRSYKGRYSVLLFVYSLLLVPFLLFGWGSYSDRFLLVPWHFIPVLLGSALSLSRIRSGIGGLLWTSVTLAAHVIFVVSVWQDEAVINMILASLGPR